jgi:hypothetical protein
MMMTLTMDSRRATTAKMMKRVYRPCFEYSRCEKRSMAVTDTKQTAYMPMISLASRESLRSRNLCRRLHSR